MLRSLLLLIVSIWLSTPAHAEWHESSSAHFVIYANQSPEKIRKYSDRLERYHNAVSFKLGQPLDKKISPSNRVTVYVVDDISRIQKLVGGNQKNVAGFYIPRAGGSVAFVPKIDVVGNVADFSEIILLHEYAHHLMFSASEGQYPLWYTEGLAEFFSSAAFEKNGAVSLGRPANHRTAEIAFATPVPLERMLDTKLYVEKRPKNGDNFYGRSWLLFHYLTYSESRKGQMTAYLRRLRDNEDELAAATAAFGDLKQLNRDLAKYLQQRTMFSNTISGTDINPGPITVRKLTDGEAAVIPLRIQSKRGVDNEQAQKILQEMRKITAAYLTDPAALAALSEAEFDAGNSADAIVAADRALALNPNEINAYLQKGLALAKLAPDAEKPDIAWSTVRKHFVKMNTIENDHPLALRHFYNSYKQQGKAPTKNAIEGLDWSLQLAPFDGELRWMVAEQAMSDKRYNDAIYTLKPLAYAPHENELSIKAIELLQKAEALAATENSKETDAKAAPKTTS
jgi:tetratricopeptide (TPR) repeat protein